MKKRIVSLMLVLTFVLLALPMSVGAAATAGNAKAGEATYTSKFEDWTAKIGTISAINDGTFQINAFDSSAAASLTNKKHARMAMWNGELAEGRFSVTFDTASILAGRGDRDDHSGANDSGIIFGGKGIKAYAVPANGSVNNVENNSQFYFLYFSNNSITLALADKAWVGLQKNAAGADLKTDLSKTHTDMWTAAKAAGKVEVTVAFSATGALRVWINGEHIPELDADNLKPFGTEIGVRNGMGFHVPTKVYDFKVYGGLDIKSHVGTVNYDPITYKWSASKDNGGKPYDSAAVNGYVTNRVVTDGKIVIMAQQVPDVLHTNYSTDPTNEKYCQAYVETGICDNAAHYNNNYYMGAIFNVTNGGKYYYMLAMKDTQTTKGGALGPGAVSIQTRLSAVIDGKWTADPTGVAWKCVMHTNSNPYSPADPITFNASTGKITWPSGTTNKFNGTNPSTYKVEEWTNPTPLTGGLYGFRADVYDDAYQAWIASMDGKWPSASPVVNANDGAWMQYYVINNQKEAMDITLDTTGLDLAKVEKNKEYSVTVKTFPEGAVINSGDTIELAGNGIKTVSAKDNGNGTYTVKFRATKDGAVSLSASVDNHIFGTLTTASESITVIDNGTPAPTGDATLLIGAGAVLVAILGSAIVIGKKRTLA